MKRFFVFAIILLLIAGGIYLYTNNTISTKNENTVESTINESNKDKVDEIPKISLMESKKVYNEKNRSWYEIIIKNISEEYIGEVEFKLGDGVYVIYDLAPEEQRKLIAYNTQDSLSIEDVVVRELTSENEVSLNLVAEKKEVLGSIKNNGENELYPQQIVYYLKGEDGINLQQTIEYAGCFDEGKIIKPNEVWKFEIDIPDGYTFSQDKGILVRYSDLSFEKIKSKIF